MDKFDKLMEMVGDSGNVFHLELNMNDVFGWACSESGELCAGDVEEIFPIYEKYDHYTLIAYEVLRRNDGSVPAHGIHKEPRYKAAMAELQELAKDGTILFEQFYNRTKNVQT